MSRGLSDGRAGGEVKLRCRRGGKVSLGSTDVTAGIKWIAKYVMIYFSGISVV